MGPGSGSGTQLPACDVGTNALELRVAAFRASSMEPAQRDLALSAPRLPGQLGGGSTTLSPRWPCTEGIWGRAVSPNLCLLCASPPFSLPSPSSPVSFTVSV